MNGPNVIVMETLAWLRDCAPVVFAQRGHLQLDSRKVKPGDAFLALTGRSLATDLPSQAPST